jgi:hypothetical protein
VELAEALGEFDAARHRAFLRAATRLLSRRGATKLVSLDRILAAAQFQGQVSRGEREIPLDKVVGTSTSVKGFDFDPGFLPLSRRQRDRWSRIYAYMMAGTGDLPPIDVYQLEDKYYVIDGHYRVSVARALGRDKINARVTELRTRVPLGPDLDRRALLRTAEYAAFLEKTHLDRVRPEARFECGRLGSYDEVFAHILGHQHFLSLEQGHEVSVEEAAASWYDNIYLPLIRLVRKYRVVEQLPRLTEADVYSEVMRRWLTRGAGGEESVDAALRSFLQAHPRRPRRRWLVVG